MMTSSRHMLEAAFVAAVAFAATSAVASEPAAAPPASLHRWGILATEDVRATGLPDLIGAALSADTSLELVERELLAETLREIDLASVLGAKSTAARLQVGKTLGAQGLMLLSMEKHAGRDALRFDLCDCRYGVRLRSEMLPYAAADREGLVQRCVARLGEVRRQHESGVRRIVCVTDFVSRNVQNTFAYMQAACGQLLRERLLRVPGVAVVELDEAEAIGRERQLQGTEIRESPTLFIRGEFRVVAAPDKTADVVNLKVELFDGRQTRDISRAGVPLGGVADVLTGDVAAEILEHMDAAGHGLKTRELAQAIAQRAQAFASLGLLDRAASLREAVLMIDPDDADQRIRLMAERPEPLFPAGYRRPDGYSDEREVVIANWPEAWQRELRLPFFMAHTEELIRRRLVNPREAVHLLELCRCEAYAEMEIVITRIGIPAVKGRVTEELSASAEAFFWRMAPLVVALDRGIAEGRNRNQMYEPLQQLRMEDRPGADPMTAAEQDALATHWLVLLNMKLGVVASSSRPMVGRDGNVIQFPGGAVQLERVVHFKDANRLDKTLDILQTLAPADLRPHPEMLLLLSDTRLPMGQWVFGQQRFSAEEKRAFHERLARSPRPGVAFCGRYGLACLDARSDDPAVAARTVTEIDWLTENYPRFALTTGNRKGHPAQRPEQACLSHLKAIRDTCQRRAAPPRTISSPLPTLADERRLFAGPEPHIRLCRQPRVVAEKLDLRFPENPRLWINCDDRFDVIVGRFSAYLMRRQGELTPLVERPADAVLQNQDLVASAAHWDGTYLWLGVGNSLRLFDAEGRKLGRLDPSTDLPDVSIEWLHIVGKGKAIMGCRKKEDQWKTRGCWFAVIEVKDDGPGRVRFETRVIHEATELSTEVTDGTLDDPRQGFGIEWMGEFSFSETEDRRLLFVGRRFLQGRRGGKPTRPLTIDLKTYEIAVFPHEFPKFMATAGISVEHRVMLPHGVVALRESGPSTEVWKAPASAARPWTKKRVPLEIDSYAWHRGHLYDSQCRRRLDPRTLEVEEMVPKGEIIPKIPLTFGWAGTSAFYGVVCWERRAGDQPGGAPYRIHIDDPQAPAPDYSDLVAGIPREGRDRHYRALLGLWSGGAQVEVWRNGRPEAPMMTHLRVFSNWAGDRDAAAAIADLYNLTDCSFMNVDRQFVEAAMPGLDRHTALRRVVLCEAGATNADLEALERLPAMEMLVLSNTEIDDAGLRAIGKLDTLTTLRLRDDSGKRLTSAGVAHIRHLPNLTRLELLGPGFGDAALGHLDGDALPKLESIGLSGCSLTTDVVRKFKQTRRPTFHIHPAPD